MSGTAIATTPAAPVDYEREKQGAAMLLKSGLAPIALKTPEAAMFVILVGRDLGLSPTQSLRSINVIQGKVEVAADMQLALLKRAGGRATFLHLDANKAELELTHPNGDKHTETFTMADAKTAQLGGPNWSKFPKAMLRSRVITAGMKSLGFDALAGVYAEGEIGGDDPTIAVDAPAVTASVSDPTPAPAAREVVDAEVVDAPTEPADALEVALAYPMPMGKSKGTELGQLETRDLESAITWAAEHNTRDRFKAFIGHATLVVASRKLDLAVVPGEAPANNPDRHDLAVAHPALTASTSDDLPF